PDQQEETEDGCHCYKQARNCLPVLFYIHIMEDIEVIGSQEALQSTSTPLGHHNPPVP
ncbi:hypothetical protein PSHT_00549, partial [Puccinia striiformis]